MRVDVLYVEWPCKLACGIRTVTRGGGRRVQAIFRLLDIDVHHEGSFVSTDYVYLLRLKVVKNASVL